MARMTRTISTAEIDAAHDLGSVPALVQPNEVFDVCAGGERRARTDDHDATDLDVTRDRLQRREKLVAHRSLEAVHHFGTIEDHLRNST